ncbi:helix-turn-helix transcriptional regulator [Polynucleobacter sp. MWH-CaK5]|uniref:helix-turn-helix domain-containing protein n=1 Tax=Polynucleobacter sp. MWH-CaK5 TaxID=2689107 RepID=UPI001BFCF5D4|nr:helix-turn-helix transcriptional regulator [Polynucleobacter sp. MWH-CaK5]
MITSGQIKAARALVDWTARELATKAEIGFSTLIRLESANGVPAGNIKTIDAVKKALEDAGIEFIGTPENGAGVRWRS